MNDLGCADGAATVAPFDAPPGHGALDRPRASPSAMDVSLRRAGRPLEAAEILDESGHGHTGGRESPGPDRVSMLHGRLSREARRSRARAARLSSSEAPTAPGGVRNAHAHVGRATARGGSISRGGGSGKFTGSAAGRSRGVNGRPGASRKGGGAAAAAVGCTSSWPRRGERERAPPADGRVCAQRPSPLSNVTECSADASASRSTWVQARFSGV